MHKTQEQLERDGRRHHITSVGRIDAAGRRTHFLWPGCDPYPL